MALLTCMLLACACAFVRSMLHRADTLCARRRAPAGTSPSTQLSREQAVALTRQWVIKGPLGAGRAALIKWLLEAGGRSGPDPSPAMVSWLVVRRGWHSGGRGQHCC
jgi:hypothetical protein